MTQWEQVRAEAAVAAGRLDPTLLGDHLDLIAESAATGRRLNRAELDRYRRRGQHAAEAGVALRALVELYLSGTWRLWPLLPQVVDAERDPAGLVRAGEAVLRCTDDGVAALTEGFQLARLQVVRRQVARRREFFDDLLSGRAEPAGLLERAGDVGIDLAAPHAVAVVAAERSFADAMPVLGQLERAIRGRFGDADSLVASKEGRLVVVFAAPDADAVVEVSERITTTLGPQPGAGTPGRDEQVELRRRAGFGSWRVGIGRPRPGPTGVRASYDEALEALDLATRLGLTDPIVEARDLLVYRVVLRDRAAIEDLVDDVLGSLRDDPARMFETLHAYLTTGGNTAATARQLHLSIRAVSYRLTRLAAVLGRDPTDPAERLALHVAVVGAQLLGWPS